MSHLALNAVSAAVFAALNVSTLTNVAPGGVHDSLPQNLQFPMVLFDVSEIDQHGGFGTIPGSGQFPEVQVRLTVYAKGFGMKAAQEVMGVAIGLLKTAPPVSGYASWAILWGETKQVPESMVAGQRVQELVSDARLFVEEGVA